MEDGGIDPEFLAALPPDIQADVLRQHQRARATAAAAAAAAAAANSADASTGGVAGEMDNGSFIATLSAELREEVGCPSSLYIRTLKREVAADDVC
jgi:hypothetical protein